MGKTFIELLEEQEIIQKLIDRGYGDFINALLTNEKHVYTKKGRLNKSGACRILGWKPKQLEDTLLACREIINMED